MEGTGAATVGQLVVARLIVMGYPLFFFLIIFIVPA